MNSWYNKKMWNSDFKNLKETREQDVAWMIFLKAPIYSINKIQSLKVCEKLKPWWYINSNLQNYKHKQ
jgi:hypothetical protein